MGERVAQAKTCLDEGCEYYAKRKLEEAERELKKALKYYEAARKKSSQFKFEISSILKLLGDIYHLRGDDATADWFYERSQYIMYNE
jgi:hypothetical protein